MRRRPISTAVLPGEFVYEEISSKFREARRKQGGNRGGGHLYSCTTSTHARAAITFARRKGFLGERAKNLATSTRGLRCDGECFLSFKATERSMRKPRARPSRKRGRQGVAPSAFSWRRIRDIISLRIASKIVQVCHRHSALFVTPTIPPAIQGAKCIAIDGTNRIKGLVN